MLQNILKVNVLASIVCVHIYTSPKLPWLELLGNRLQMSLSVSGLLRWQQIVLNKNMKTNDEIKFPCCLVHFYLAVRFEKRSCTKQTIRTQT